MAKPIDFEQSNFVWTGWEESTNTPNVGDLPAYKYGDYTISCWKLSLKERLKALFTGRIWLHVIGRQPPVFVSSDFPFPVIKPRQQTDDWKGESTQERKHNGHKHESA